MSSNLEITAECSPHTRPSTSLPTRVRKYEQRNKEIVKLLQLYQKQGNKIIQEKKIKFFIADVDSSIQQIGIHISKQKINKYIRSFV